MSTPILAASVIVSIGLLQESTKSAMSARDPHFSFEDTCCKSCAWNLHALPIPCKHRPLDQGSFLKMYNCLQSSGERVMLVLLTQEMHGQQQHSHIPRGVASISFPFDALSGGQGKCGWDPYQNSCARCSRPRTTFHASANTARIMNPP
jgi:hypothetical protein